MRSMTRAIHDPRPTAHLDDKKFYSIDSASATLTSPTATYSSPTSWSTPPVYTVPIPSQSRISLPTPSSPLSETTGIFLIVTSKPYTTQHQTWTKYLNSSKTQHSFHLHKLFSLSLSLSFCFLFPFFSSSRLVSSPIYIKLKLYNLMVLKIYILHIRPC